MNTIHSIVAWFEQANPNPDAKDISVQLGCHYEEVAEGLQAMGDIGTASAVNSLANVYKSAPECFLVHISSLSDATKVKLLDSLCDQIITAVGVATRLGMDIEGGLAETNRSNWSKFVDGIPQFNDQGKISKGPSYTPPELTQFIGGENDRGYIPVDSDN